MEGVRTADWQEHLQAAVTAENKGEHEKALEQLSLAESKAPDDIPSHTDLAVLCERIGQRRRAMGHLERAIRLADGRSSEKDSENGYCRLVQGYLEEGLPEEAERILREHVFARWPESLQGNYWQALLELRKDGDAAALAAARCLEFVLKREPANAKARYQYGVSLSRLKRWEDAERAFRKVLETNTQHASAHYELSKVLQRLGKTEEAREPLAKFQELDAKMRRKSQLETQVALRKASLPETLELGELYLQLNEPQRARAILLHYTQQEPADARGHALLAEAYQRLQDTGMAAASKTLAAALRDAEEFRALQGKSPKAGGQRAAVGESNQGSHCE